MTDYRELDRLIVEAAAAVIAEMRDRSKRLLHDTHTDWVASMLDDYACRLEHAQWQARDTERQRCLSIIRDYQVPAGNSQAGELAASWMMDALREVCAEIESGASLAGPDRDLEATTLAASKGETHGE